MRVGLACWLGMLLFLASCGDDVKKEYWENGNIKSELRYEGEKLNGVCTWYLPNGKPQMEVCYRDNQMNGLLRRWHENGNLMEECWYRDGVQDSVSKVYSLHGTLVCQSYYRDGKLDGAFKRWYENGQLFQDGQYAEDMMDGSWWIFYPDGALAATASFDKGAGVQTSYEQSGYKCLVTNYLDNVKHGKETYYNPDGRVTRVAYYEYGEWVRDE